MCRQTPIAPDPSAELLSPSQRLNLSQLAPPAATCPVQPRGPGASGLLPPPPSHPPAGLRGRDGAGPPQPAAGSEGERLRGRGEDGPLPPGGAGAGAAASGRLALVLAALNPPASALRGEARCGAGVPRLAPLTNRRCLALPLA